MKIAPKIEERIVMLYEKGDVVKQICYDTRVHRATVQRVINRNNVSKRRPEALEAYTKHFTLYISERMHEELLKSKPKNLTISVLTRQLFQDYINAQAESNPRRERTLPSSMEEREISSRTM